MQPHNTPNAKAPCPSPAAQDVAPWTGPARHSSRPGLTPAPWASPELPGDKWSDTDTHTHTHQWLSEAAVFQLAHPAALLPLGCRAPSRVTLKRPKAHRPLIHTQIDFFLPPPPQLFFPKSCCFKVVLGNFHSLSPLVIKSCQVLSSKWSAADYQGRRSPYLNYFDQSLFC